MILSVRVSCQINVQKMDHLDKMIYIFPILGCNKLFFKLTLPICKQNVKNLWELWVCCILLKLCINNALSICVFFQCSFNMMLSGLVLICCPFNFTLNSINNIICVSLLWTHLPRAFNMWALVLEWAFPNLQKLFCWSYGTQYFSTSKIHLHT